MRLHAFPAIARLPSPGHYYHYYTASYHRGRSGHGDCRKTLQRRFQGFHARIRTIVPSTWRSHAPPKITLRAARSADFDFALTLYLESTKPLLLDLGHWDEERVRTRFAQDFEPRSARVIHNAGLTIGWIQVSDTAQSYHL